MNQIVNQPAASPEKKKVLHVGCGTKAVMERFQTPEWQEVRLDIDPSVNPDILASMTDLSMLGSEKFDAIWSSHNIEHLYPHDVPKTLKEFYRVLKPDGMLLIACPDLQSVAEYVYKGNLEGVMYHSPAGPISAIDTLYGLRTAMAKGNLFMAHRMGFTAGTMVNHLRKAGFNYVKVVRDNLDLAASGVKNPADKEGECKVEIIDKDFNKIMEVRDNIDKEPEFAEGWRLGA